MTAKENLLNELMDATRATMWAWRAMVNDWALADEVGKDDLWREMDRCVNRAESTAEHIKNMMGSGNA